MNVLAKRIQTTYLALLFGNTLSASLIWGVNTLFLLDAGLSNFEAFAANAFFTLGMVIFEVPTGVVADSWSRRASYLLGTLTLSLSTLLYYVLWQLHAPFSWWAVVSLLLGLGFSFFSGAVEAWLVDALTFAKYDQPLEFVFGKGQVVTGIAMLLGSIGGGLLADATSLGAPFILRGIILLVLFTAAAMFMRDYGFTPENYSSIGHAMRGILHNSIRYGLRSKPVRWMMIAAIFTGGVGVYAFYALQPYLLELYGNSHAYWVAGLAAGIVAGSQIAGGILAPRMARVAQRRTTTIIVMTIISCITLVGIGLTDQFLVAIILISTWGLAFAAIMPVRQAYMNAMIPSKQRATVLSFDSLMGNSGGIFIQPALGKVADVYSYGTSLLVGGIIQLAAIPFLLLSRKSKHSADVRDIQK